MNGLCRAFRSVGAYAALARTLGEDVWVGAHPLVDR